MPDEDDTAAAAPSGMAILKLSHKIKSLAASVKWFIEDVRARQDKTDADLKDVRERLAKLEGQHEYLREDQTGARVAVAKKETTMLPPPPRLPGKGEALSVLKAVGPWILGLLAIIGTLVNALLDK